MSEATPPNNTDVNTMTVQQIAEAQAVMERRQIERMLPRIRSERDFLKERPSRTSGQNGPEHLGAAIARLQNSLRILSSSGQVIALRQDERPSAAGSNVGKTASETLRRVEGGELGMLAMHEVQDAIAFCRTQQTLRKCFSPPDPLNLTKALAKAWVKTKHSVEQAGSRKETLAIYAEDLMQYPADIVMHHVLMIPDQFDYFPSWLELTEGIKFWTEARHKRARTALEALGCDVKVVR